MIIILVITKTDWGFINVSKHSSWSSFVVSSFLGLGMSSALAQQAEPDPAAAPVAPVATDDASVEMETIVVNGAYTIREKIDMATGLGLSPQETPQSVTVITQQQIQDQGLTNLVDVVSNAVGVSTNEIDDVRNTFYARGFEISNYQVDGVPLAWSLAADSGETLADTALYDRIEVVRGATGLMTGVGDPSASINLVRKHADSAEFSGYAEAGYGSWDQRQVTADVGGGLNASGSIRGRFVGKIAQGNSYQDLLENQDSLLYGVVDADLSDNTLVRVGASYQDNDPTSPTWGALPTWYTDGSHTDLPRSTTTAADWTRWHTMNTNVFANVVHSFGNGWQLIANYNHLKNAQRTHLLYLSGQLDRDTGVEDYAYPYRASGESKQDSFDAQLKGFFNLFERKHEFVLGALHSEQDAHTISYPALAYDSPAGSLYTWDGSYPEPEWGDASVAQDLTTKQDGYYGAMRFSVTDALKLIVGGRLANWDRKGASYGVAENFGDDNVFIPYAGALYDLTPTHRVYASYTEIYKPQNAREVEGSYVDPVTGKSSEIGLKSRFMDDALQTTLSLFLVKQDNLAQAIPGAVVDGTGDQALPEQAYRGAKGAESKGFEAEVVGRPTERLNVSLGYTQFKAEDADGNKINTEAARRMLKLFATWEVPGATLKGLTVGGGVNWQDEIYGTVGPNPVTGDPDRVYQGSYALVQLMARYAVNPNLSFQLNANNITDEKYYSQVNFFSQYRYGDPANYMGTVRYTF